MYHENYVIRAQTPPFQLHNYPIEISSKSRSEGAVR